MKAFPPLIKLLVDNETAHACIFVNFKSECSKHAGEFEEMLGAASIRTVHLVQINGDMDKNEIFAFIRLFTTSVRLRRYYPRVLVATPAANTGIEQMLVVYVLRVGLPRSITMMLQERGRCLRNPVVLSYFVLFVDWSLFIFVLITVVLPVENNSSDELSDYTYAGSMIDARTPARICTTSNTTNPTSTQRAPLSSAQQQNNIVEGYNDLLDILHLKFLPGYGCIHLRGV